MIFAFLSWINDEVLEDFGEEEEEEGSLETNGGLAISWFPSMFAVFIPSLISFLSF